ncbi:MAG: family 43 glycosylhydrolase [Puniceicoccaceae bacterium]
MEQINIIGQGVTDPHIRIFNDRAYLYASHDAAADSDRFVMRDWQVWSSDDLLDWQLESTLKPEETYIGKPIDGCWATDAVEKDGKYYWAFSEVDKPNDRHQIGMVVADSPVGPWKDVLGQPLIHDRLVATEVYDPCFFKDDDGTVYILFGVWDYYIAEMADDMLSIKGKPVPLTVEKPEGPYGPGKTDDKVFLHKRDGLYYLSWGSYYATSNNPTGPYRYRGCIVEPRLMEDRFRESTWPHGPTQGRHGSFFEWNGQWFFVYCEMCFSGNRYYRDFWISYVHYRENGEIEPIRINSMAVGAYDANAGPIAAADFLKGSHATTYPLDGSGHAVLLKDGGHIDFPQIHGLDERPMISIKLKAEGRHPVLMIESVQGDPAEQQSFFLDWVAGKDWQSVNTPLDFQLSDPIGLRLRSAGENGSTIELQSIQFFK